MAQISLVYARDVTSPFTRWQIGEIPSAKKTAWFNGPKHVFMGYDSNFVVAEVLLSFV
jgi:hypothetical protein